MKKLYYRNSPLFKDASSKSKQRKIERSKNIKQVVELNLPLDPDERREYKKTDEYKLKLIERRLEQRRNNPLFKNAHERSKQRKIEKSKNMKQVIELNLPLDPDERRKYRQSDEYKLKVIEYNKRKRLERYSIESLYRSQQRYLKRCNSLTDVLRDYKGKTKQFPLNPNYIVFDDGRVYSFNSERFKQQSTNNDGYKYIAVRNFNSQGNTRFLVHRIVAYTFLDNTLNLPEVHHKNGVRFDNRLENLEWITRRDNLNKIANRSQHLHTPEAILKREASKARNRITKKAS